MSLDQHKATEYTKILEEELILALGCTEPISLAYAAAIARKELGGMADRIVVNCSGNIIKNVKCVAIPHAEQLKGVCASALIGFVGGNPERQLEVLHDVTDEDIKTVQALLKENSCSIDVLDSDIPVHIRIDAWRNEEFVSVEIRYTHTNVYRIIRNQTIIFQQAEASTIQTVQSTNRDMLDVDDIYEYANTVSLERLAPLIHRQVHYNLKIAEEGIHGQFGVGLGKMILNSYPESSLTRVRAYTAAASEARMGGCNLPVVINSGSGNQGITASVPVAVFGREFQLPDDRVVRALIFSNLLTIYQKNQIGRLSAFCGAVSAAAASGAAIAYLSNATLEQIKKVISNTLADVSGIICDGAKLSCAAKIASALDASLMAYHLAMKGIAYNEHEGILQQDVDNTIRVVGHLALKGMKSLDREILNVMTT